MARAFFIYGGRRPLSEKSVQILPLESAFLELPEILAGSKSQR
jgi:hypothetical protein